MPRRREVPKRKVLPDIKYGDVMVSQFINGIMRRGKKSLAETVLYSAFDVMAEKTGEPPLKVFKQAIDNVRPLVEVKSRRVGGATYQVPVEVRSNRRQALAIRWLVRYATARSERTMAERLGNELIAAFKNEGSSVKKREDTHKMAEANKAFAHFRW